MDEDNSMVRNESDVWGEPRNCAQCSKLWRIRAIVHKGYRNQCHHCETNTAVAMVILLLLLLFPSLRPTTSAVAVFQQRPCPVDFTFARTLPWNTSCCPHLHACCCQHLLCLLGIAHSLRLRQTNAFAFPDVPTSAACLDSLQSVLTAAFSHPTSLVASCFPSDILYIPYAATCAGIHTAEDFAAKLNTSAVPFNASCATILKGKRACGACRRAVRAAALQLQRVHGSVSPFDVCYNYTVVYAAGVLSARGPTDASTARCLFRLPLVRPLPSCPIDFGFMRGLGWDASCCRPSGTNTGKSSCCPHDLLRIFGIGLSIRLKRTGIFGLPDDPTVVACLDSLQSTLTTSFSLPGDTVRALSVDDISSIRSNSCAGISTVEDFHRKLPDTDALNVSCRLVAAAGDVCNPCINSVENVELKLLAIDRNSDHVQNCYYLTLVYTAGLITSRGPTDNDTVHCIFFGQPLRIPSLLPSGSSSGFNKRLLIWTAPIAAAVAIALALLAVFLYRERVRRARLRERDSWVANMGATRYTIDELRRATLNFAESNLIGRGGFAVVYKGVLSDGSIVAVKKLLDSNLQDEGDEEFANEVGIISNLRHRNLVSLRGCCITGNAAGGGKQRYLVYDYMPRGSLHDHLSEPRRKSPLTWGQRRSIILDIARGLAYLHHGIKPAIIHRDIKPSNILLGEEMRAAVADFGLARRTEHGTRTYQMASKVAGTRGYMAPEYALYGHLSSKVDVYGFGVMVLEIMSGRRAFDSSSVAGEEPVVVAQWAQLLMRAGRVADVLEGLLLDGAGDDAVEEMERFVMVGSLCAHLRVGRRPTMEDALKMLEGDMPLP